MSFQFEPEEPNIGNLKQVIPFAALCGRELAERRVRNGLELLETTPPAPNTTWRDRYHPSRSEGVLEQVFGTFGRGLIVLGLIDAEEARINGFWAPSGDMLTDKDLREVWAKAHANPPQLAAGFGE